MKNLNSSGSLTLIPLLFILLIYSCNKDDNSLNHELNSPVLDQKAISDNQRFDGEVPAATVLLKEYEMNITTRMESPTCVEPVTPASVALSLQPSESSPSTLTGCIEALPPKGDVLFMMDLTGSLSEELANLKSNSINIMNELSTSISDAHFGLISHMDYPEPYISCGYSGTYGYSSFSDYPYALNQSLTANKGDVSTSIIDLNLANGGDMPESYERALYETLYDSDIAWRDGSAKIVVSFLDNIPHSCSLGTGSDPGRDGIMGNEDDIDFEEVIDEMVDQNLVLIVINSGEASVGDIWTPYAEATGGQVFNISSDGTFPDGTDITSALNDIITANLSEIDELKLETEVLYSAWVNSPTIYNNISTIGGFEDDFDLTYSVPLGTTAGLYSFGINLVGDGANYGTQVVSIEVITDQDGDGCLDDNDPHPNSDDQEFIVINGCDTGVPNQFVTPCSTMMDLIQDCIDNASNHGQMVSCISALTNEWKSDGLISGKQKGKIMSCS